MHVRMHACKRLFCHLCCQNAQILTVSSLLPMYFIRILQSFYGVSLCSCFCYACAYVCQRAVSCKDPSGQSFSRQHVLLKVVVQPNETLFETGDDSSSGIFIVLEGAIGVYMHDGDKLMHTNTLRPGESVGDVDILDGMQNHHQRHACRLCFHTLQNPRNISCTSTLFNALLWHAQHGCACQRLSLHRLFFIAVWLSLLLLVV